MDDIGEWNIRRGEDILVPVIQAWRTVGMGQHVGIQIKTGPILPEQPADQFHQMEWAMTTEQLRRFARDLLAAAEMMDARQGKE